VSRKRARPRRRSQPEPTSRANSAVGRRSHVDGSGSSQATQRAAGGWTSRHAVHVTQDMT
jgi:hypothetical protein